MKRYVSEAIPTENLPQGDELSRADVVFVGVDHSSVSYEGRVFLNNPKADVGTPRHPDEGYAGSFTVFGHGACYGEEGHCDPRTQFRDSFDVRPPHPLEPITRIVIVTEALRRIQAPELVVTVVPVEHGGKEGVASDALAFDELRLLAYMP